MLHKCEETIEPCTSSEARMPEYETEERDDTSDEVSDTEPVQLQPFIHQVGGHSCVLRFNETTLCKPLNTREHLFYENVPLELKEFVPAYRGVIEVELQEDSDGQVNLIGYPIQTDGEDARPGSQRSSPGFGRATSPGSSGSETETTVSPVLRTKNKQPRQASNDNYSIVLLGNGGIGVRNHSEKVFHSPDSKSGQKPASSNPWSVKCHKRALAKMRTDHPDSDLYKFIRLENVAAQFRYPCILDLKMGTRQHGDDASEAKKRSNMKKCQSTTSGAVGVRLIGMQVYQSTSGQFVCQNKYFGRGLTVQGFKEALELFLNNGEKLRVELLDPILSRLQHLHSLVQKQESFRFYSSSLLIMYGGHEHRNLDQENDNHSSPLDQRTQTANENQIDVRMIDFAHSTYRGFYDDKEIHKGADQGHLFGLENLILMFQDIKKKHQQEVVS